MPSPWLQEQEPLVSNIQFKDVRTYRYDFFSGANIGVWFGNTLAAEAIAIEYSLVQTKRPIFGWASPLFDAVAGGVVHVAGSLYVNFREAHMFTALIDRASGVYTKETQRGFPINDNQNFSSYVSGMTETEINNFEDAVWGEGTGEKINNPTAMQIDTNERRIRRPDDHGTGFDILITYGDRMSSHPSVNSTSRRLWNVHVTGFGQTIEIDGKPVLEAYNFLCRQVL